MLAYLKREVIELKGRIEFHEKQLASDMEKLKTAKWKRSIAELEGRIQFSHEQIPRDKQRLEQVLAKIAEIERRK
jgi:predicted  nucleic acid-binding Zn-ribbon protein